MYDVSARERRGRRIQGGGGYRFVGALPLSVIEAYSAGKSPEQLRVGDRLAEWHDRPLIQRQIQMPPGEHDVELLQLRGSREYDVCVPGRVSEELLAHHREKIFALEASDNLVLFRDNNRRIGVVDEQGFNGRIELVFVQERRAEAPLIQHARSGLDPIRPHQRFPFDWEGPNWQLQNAAPNSAPRTDEGRKARGTP